MSPSAVARDVLDVMAVRATGDPGDAVLRGLAPERVENLRCEVLVVGGGTGGVAAALAAAHAGRSVCLTEETDWIGGQLTAQGISALDEHEHIERFGGTRSYYALRERIRDHYRTRSPILAAERHPNPGTCWVTRLAFEPRVAVAVLESMLAPYVERGRLRVFRRTKAWSVDTANERITALTAVHLDARRWMRLIPGIVIDATELGDVLPLAGAEYVSGAETITQTGEPHAQPAVPKPECVQSFTFAFVLEKTDAGERHVIATPAKYEHYRDTQPYALRIHVHGGEIYGEQTTWLDYRVMDQAPGTKGGLWTYRRLIDAAKLPGRFARDVTMFNWPGNDYRDVNIVDRTPEEQARALQDAKRVSLGFLHWLQTEAPRRGGAPGFPELKPRPDVLDTADALGKYPYIRESRRLVARGRIVEQDVSADFNHGARARHFEDSVGVGWYPIDIHRCACPDDVGVSCRTKPFQIPMGALIAARVKNLLAGAKNLGSTHITNGCFRLHPVEWNVGESAGLLAAFALDTRQDPAAVHASGTARRELQRRLVDAGVPLCWSIDVGVDDPAFARVQLAMMSGEITPAADRLEIGRG
jgi:FAD dependent oxidoreductase